MIYLDVVMCCLLSFNVRLPLTSQLQYVAVLKITRSCWDVFWGNSLYLLTCYCSSYHIIPVIALTLVSISLRNYLNYWMQRQCYPLFDLTLVKWIKGFIINLLLKSRSILGHAVIASTVKLLHENLLDFK